MIVMHDKICSIAVTFTMLMLFDGLIQFMEFAPTKQALPMTVTMLLDTVFCMHELYIVQK